MKYLAKYLTREYAYPTRLLEITYQALGLFIFFYSIVSIPSATLIYSNQGVLPDYSLNNLPQAVSIFNFVDTPAFIIGTLGALSLVGAGMLLRITHAALPFLAWILYISFQNRNIFTMHPTTDVVGFMLFLYTLLLLFVSKKEGPNSYIPATLYHGSWLLLGLTFTMSGLDRLRNEEWLSGAALNGFFNIIPVASNIFSQTLHHVFSNLPQPLLWLLTWFVAGTFTLALPFALYTNTRKILLGVLFVFFFVVLLISELRQVVFGLFLFFLFLSDIYYPYAQTFYTRHLAPFCIRSIAYIKRLSFF